MNGNRILFWKLVEPEHPKIWAFCRKLAGNRDDGDDLYQDALVTALRKFESLRDNGSFRPWLYRIVTNLCYNRLPQLKRELNALDGLEEMLLADERQNTGRVYLNQEMRRDIYAAIDDLADSYRLLITLRHLQGLSYAEIAEVTGMPLGTVKTGIYRARRQLREALETWNEIA